MRISGPDRQPPLSPFELVRVRAAVERALRVYFDETGAIEVCTPTLVASPGMEPHLRALAVECVEATALGPRFLHTSPEYAIKATLAQLDADVFTFARSFRDEPPGRWHWPEFTMLEWYRRGDTQAGAQADCEQILLRALRATADTLGVDTPDTAPLARIRCDEAFARWADLDIGHDDTERLRRDALRAGLRVAADWDRDAIFTLAWIERVEKGLASLGPALLTHFPAWQAALARLDRDDPRWAERFELYVPLSEGDGEPQAVELANAFVELTDADEQRARFIAEQSHRRTLGLPVYPLPESMLDGLRALGPTVGVALGLERLLVVCTALCGRPGLRVVDFLLGAEPVRDFR